MDEDIARWILEYLLRQPIDDLLLNSILSILPIENTDSRIKKTLLLRRIESEVSNPPLTEKALELLEIIEELDHREERPASEAMKVAYCAVAVDCTVRFLDTEAEKNRKYFETVKRIWRGRIGKMEKGSDGIGRLVSEGLMRWKEDIEDAGWDPSVRQKILMANTRCEAGKAVRGYLAEAWDEMGPAFLQLAAQRFREMGCLRKDETRDFERQQGGRGRDEVLDSDNACRELIVLNPLVVGGTGDRLVGNESVAGACGSSGAQDGLVANRFVARNCGTGRVQDGLGDKGSIHGGGGFSKGHNLSEVESDKRKCKLRDNYIGHHGKRFRTVAGISRVIKITEIDGMDDDLCMGKGDHLLDTPEVRGVQEALKSSSVELHKVVEDPLPSALESAEEISARIKRNDGMNIAVAEEDYDGKVHVPSSHINVAIEDTQQKGNFSTGVQGSRFLVGKDEDNQNNPASTNVKDRNLGSVACRWDHLIDSSAGPSSTCPHLPCPKSSNLATFEKFTRRKRKMWSLLEEDTLRQGVNKFGVGNWKLIYNVYREIFKDRTEVDLKDKWRNLTR